MEKIFCNYHQDMPYRMEEKMNNDINTQGKDWLTTLLFALFLGFFGVHRFYTGYKVIGFLQIITFGGLGIWLIIDVIQILTGMYKDKNGNYLVFGGWIKQLVSAETFKELIKQKTPRPVFFLWVITDAVAININQFYSGTIFASIVSFIAFFVNVGVVVYLSNFVYKFLHRKG